MEDLPPSTCALRGVFVAPSRFARVVSAEDGAVRIVVIFLLVLANAIFVAAEYALVTARRSRLVERAERGRRGAKTALRLMDDPVRFISTVQVGITVSAILLGAIGEPLVSHFLEQPLSPTISFLIAFAILTYLSVVLGELVPKAVALQMAERLAIALSVPLDWLARIAHPLVWTLQKSANAVLRLLRVKPAPAGMIAYTREDIRHSVAAAEDVGELQQAEEEMLYKVFDFASKEVSEVMVPRPDVVAIAAEMPPEEALATVVDSPYTRYPVYRNSLDEIIGILHVRDLFAAMHDLGIESVRLESIARPAYVVPETKDLAALLADFRREKQHMAIVVDEYGERRRHRHARGPARGDRRRDRGRVRLAGHLLRADRRQAGADRRLVHDRRLQRDVRHRARAGGVPHDGGTRLRVARAGS